jgi:hypothetical protein
VWSYGSRSVVAEPFDSIKPIAACAPGERGPVFGAWGDGGLSGLNSLSLSLNT